MSLRTDILTLFPGGKEQTGYIRVKCPFHKGGNERRPSMSIIIEDGHNGKPAGYARCFTCGWEGDFVDIAEYFGLQYVNDTEIIHRSESSEKPTALTTQQAVTKKTRRINIQSILHRAGYLKRRRSSTEFTNEKTNIKSIYQYSAEKDNIYLLMHEQQIKRCFL